MNMNFHKDEYGGWFTIIDGEKIYLAYCFGCGEIAGRHHTITERQLDRTMRCCGEPDYKFHIGKVEEFVREHQEGGEK